MEFGSILLAAIGIGLLIFLHEAGHFLAARLAGVRVEVFSLGFGTRLCGFVYKGTDFRLSLVPFGGYVLVAGADPSDRRYPARESLWAKSISQRALFWSGGVLMNLLFALVAFPIAFRSGVEFTAPIVGRVQDGSAAWEAGVAPGERIVAIGGKELYSFDNLVVEVALTGGRPTPLRLRASDGSERTVTVLPQWNGTDGRYELGVEPAFADAPAVLEVKADSAAQKAGVLDADRLLAVDGRPVTAPIDEATLATLTGGGEFLLRVRRDDKELELRLQPTPATKPAPARIGVTLLPRVVRGLRPDVPFVQKLGIARGDLVLAIDEVPFTSGNLDVASAGNAGPMLRVLVRRFGREVRLEQPATREDRIAFAKNVVCKPDDSLLLFVMPDHAAAAAGMRSGDRIVSVNGKPVRTFDDLRQVVEDSDGKSLALVVARTGTSLRLDLATGDLELGERAEFVIAPRQPPQFDSGLQPAFGLRTETVRAESFGAALALGSALSVDMIKQLYVTMKRMVTGDVGTKNLGGIIRISQVSYQAAQRGYSWFLYLLAMLSLNLAFVNLLPIPVLDGGHLMFLLIEKVKGSPVSSRVFGYSQVVGLVFVLMLVLFVTYNDILQLL